MPRENNTPSEEVEKGTNILNYMEEPVHTIFRKYLDNFQGHSTVSTGWFNPGHEWLKRKFYTIETDFNEKVLKRILKVNISKHTKKL